MTDVIEPKPIARLLIVDDETNTCHALKRAFDLLGYQADTALSAERAFALLRLRSYDVMLLDLRMPGMDGVQAMREVSQQYPDLKVIIMTAHASLQSAIAAVKAGAVDYLLKPQKIPDIQAAVEKALEKLRSEQQRKRLIHSIADAVRLLESDAAGDVLLPSETSRVHYIQFQDHAILLDLEKRQFVLQAEPPADDLRVELTSHEFALLSFMMQQPGKVFSSRELAMNTIGYSNISEKEAKAIIRPHITRLRKKIEPSPSSPSFVRTIRGKGYVFSIQ